MPPLHIQSNNQISGGTRILGILGRENWHHSCAQNIAPLPQLSPRKIAVPARTPKQPCRSRRQSLANPKHATRRHSRDRSDTLPTMDGTSLKHGRWPHWITLFCELDRSATALRPGGNAIWTLQGYRACRVCSVLQRSVILTGVRLQHRIPGIQPTWRGHTSNFLVQGDMVTVVTCPFSRP